MKLLDLYCGAGGAAYGYHLAGYDVTGVDRAPQPRYPFKFVRADALEYLYAHGHEYDLVHASPPCQRYSEATPLRNRAQHPDLIAPTRAALRATGKPYIIENVENARAQLLNPIKLCGTMFGLLLWRHRYFETWPPIAPPAVACHHTRGIVQVTINGEERAVAYPVLCTGGADGPRSGKRHLRPRQPVVEVRWAMELPWMTQAELSEAIPPAYTHWLGARMIDVLTNRTSV